MPVTITLEQLAHHVRIDLSADADDPTRLILADLLNAATATVEHYAPDAPVTVQNMSVAQFCKWGFDMPNFARRSDAGLVFVNSGGAGLLNPWRSARVEAAQP